MYQITDLLHEGRTVDVPCHHIVTTVSTWVAELVLPWPGARRYGFRPAPPGGLALVHDFLNSRAHPEKGPDLIGDGTSARAWAATAIHNWSVPASRDLSRARRDRRGRRQSPAVGRAPRHIIRTRMHRGLR